MSTTFHTCVAFFRQDGTYVPVDVPITCPKRLELGGLVCANGYVPLYLEEQLAAGVQGAFNRDNLG